MFIIYYMFHTKPVITDLNVDELKLLQTNMGNRVLIIKFGAEWCGPCKKIAPVFYDFINSASANFIFADIDIDTNIDLYIALKKQKMVQGVPVFLAFFGDVKRDHWYIPDDSMIGADETQLKAFFDRCTRTGYTYYT